ncbi:MAG: RecX family transcriptional regulator [Rhodospirillales bacterium]|nr:RecX family transcriptional regulator [Rhodospirillales bacterium]
MPKPPKKATASFLENSALHYLERFATSAANLRRVLMRKVERSAYYHGTDPEEGAVMVDRLIARFEQSALLDDATYAAARAKSLHRRGTSARAIRAKLMQKGVGPDFIDQALSSLAAEDDPNAEITAELTAAATLARRRRLGPWRTPEDRPGAHEKDLAALARAGFSFDVARKVIEAPSPAALEEETDGQF